MRCRGKGDPRGTSAGKEDGTRGGLWPGDMRSSIRFAIFLVFLVPAAGAATPKLHDGILSPNFPQGYPNNVQQSWEIAVPEGYGIRIYFTHLDIEPSENCSYDSVQIMIGDVVEATLCGQSSSYVGTTPTMKYDKYFVSNSMTVTFKSDFSNQQRYTGFAAYYVAEDVNECEDLPEEACSHFCNNYIGGYFCSCHPEYYLYEDQRTCGVNCSGAVYTELKGNISSHNYPELYPENAKCDYRIQLEYGYKIVVVFQDFDIEPDDSGRCIYDNLVVKANSSTYGPFCGSSIPDPPEIKTQSNVIDIIFETDSGSQHKGWKIHYYGDAVRCSNDVSPKSTLEPQKSEYIFKDVVKVVCQEGYEVVEDYVGKKFFWVECRSDGRWNRTEPACQPVNCGPPADVGNAKILPLSGPDNYNYMAEIRYSCTEKYYYMEPIGNDGTYHCSANATWEKDLAETNLPTCVPVCGIPSTPLDSVGKIFGGQKAKEGMFPWQVLFESPLGGGALISDEWVLTAAHVAEKEDNPVMYAGITSKQPINLQQDKALHPKKVFLHSKWKQTMSEPRTDFDNDIALIKLETKVQLGELVSPICLPGPDQEYIPVEGKYGHISGWGRMEKRNTVRFLQMATIPVMNMENCRNVKPDIGESSQYVFTDNMICAGGEGKDSCQGDSGGAFAVPVPLEETRYYAAGIVSWGPRCGTYGLYTNVRNYLDWIHKTMKEHKDT